MSHPVVIVDTRVVEAGLHTANEAPFVARILDGMLAAAFRFAASEAPLTEYHAVLVQPALRKSHGLTRAEVEIIRIRSSGNPTSSPTDARVS